MHTRSNHQTREDRTMTRGQAVYAEVQAKLCRDGYPMTRVYFHWPAGTSSAGKGGHIDCIPRDAASMRRELGFNGAIVTKVDARSGALS